MNLNEGMNSALGRIHESGEAPRDGVVCRIDQNIEELRIAVRRLDLVANNLVGEVPVDLTTTSAVQPENAAPSVLGRLESQADDLHFLTAAISNLTNRISAIS